MYILKKQNVGRFYQSRTEHFNFDPFENMLLKTKHFIDLMLLNSITATGFNEDTVHLYIANIITVTNVNMSYYYLLNICFNTYNNDCKCGGGRVYT